MRHVLITGASGFVGSHLVDLAAAQGATVVGVGRVPAEPRAGMDYAVVDLLDADATRATVRDARPDAVFHLAAIASVSEAWASPHATWDNNVGATRNVLEAVRAEAPEAVLLAAGSGEQYGPVPGERQPIGEHEPPRPQNPYAASKAAADLLTGFYVDVHGIRGIRTRAFNHAGPGQSDAYVVSAFASQIAAAERDGKSATLLQTGNLEPRRDFTDVRDVVRAYWDLAERAEVGTFNVCSGVSVAILDILQRLARLTKLEVEHQMEPARGRKHEVMDIRGSHERLTAATGWKPEIPLEQTLVDTLDWWRANV